MTAHVQPPAEMSPRARLAAAARRAALADPDVIQVRGTAGATAVAGGGFEVTLAVVTRMVPLGALAERLRERVCAAAAEVQGASVSDVSIAVVDVWSPAEEAAAPRAMANAAAEVDTAAREPAPDALPAAGATSAAAGAPG